MNICINKNKRAERKRCFWSHELCRRPFHFESTHYTLVVYRLLSITSVFLFILHLVPVIDIQLMEIGKGLIQYRA